MKKKTVGLLGAPVIIGLMLETVEAAHSENEAWSYVDINPRPKIEEGCNRGSKLSIIRKFAHIFWQCRKVDVLCVVYIEARSNFMSLLARFWGVKVVYYWLGTDVYNLMRGRYSSKAICDSAADLHLAYGQNLIDELSDHGIQASLHTTPPALPTELAPMPDRHAVLLSIPDARREFYGYNDLMKLVREFPNVKFCVVRTESPELYQEPNIEYKGMLSQDEMNELFKEVSIVIRYPEHDGTSLILMESLIKGKMLISKNAFPYAILAKTYDELVSSLRELLAAPLIPNIEGHDYAVQHFSQEQAGNRLATYLGSL